MTAAPARVAAPAVATGAGGALRVIERRDLAEGVVGLTLADPAGERLPPWTPGAHIDLHLSDSVIRQYSLCGDRWDGFRYQIAVLRTSDSRGGSAWVHEHLVEGMDIGYGGPRNQFPMVPADEYRFIAGGIGITPLRPMIEQAKRTGRPWRLLYGGRHRASMAFVDELADCADQVEVAPQDETGLLDVTGWLGAAAPRVAVYCCGPEGLIAAAVRACESWPRHALRTERFVAPAQPSVSGDRTFTLRLRSGPELQVPPGVSTLEALSSLGVNVLSSCRQGICGTCEVGVLSGVPDHRDSVLTQSEREAGDCMLACVSRAHSAALTVDL